MNRPTFNEFLARARLMDVRVFEFHAEEIGVVHTVLFRPVPDGGPELMLTLAERPGEGPLSSATIVRYCRALNLKPHDFGVFIG